MSTPAQPTNSQPTPEGFVPEGYVLKKKKRGGCAKVALILVAIVLGLGILGAIFGGGDTEGSSESAADGAAQLVDGDAAADDSAKDEASADVPQEHRNALRQADVYANTMHMSYAGIYDQLTSEYGGQFSAEAAQYAVDNVETDWNANALEKAKTYVEDMAMSPAAVYDQLVSEYGEQFTPEQAQYAVDNL
ncbi:Ltp family lipoprotein [Corynebacterium uterequi]|uniref:Putative DUF1535 family protein n=1 Tax=Corynebacterium uterequi TaxID=1072256 RepID=A0A0G3HDF5_9CORY|nr:Ltp family lipoprotein [Corynebacterium uterequi]AKK10725.1 putative DUF1535 family protein [Corynebacterium uterequi]